MLSRKERRRLYREAYGDNWWKDDEIKGYYSSGIIPAPLDLETRKAVDLNFIWGDDEVDWDAVEEWIETAIGSAPYATTFSDAGIELVQCIHAIPQLFVGVDLSEVDLYVGRARNRCSNLIGRWGHHHQKEGREHDFGMVAFRCATTDALNWEDMLVKIVHELKNRDCLCVNNIAKHGGGGVPEGPETMIYITWALTSNPQKHRPVTTKDVRDISQILAKHGRKLGITQSSLRDVLLPATDTEMAAMVGWLEEHQS